MTKHARFFLLPSFILISAALIAGCNDKGEEKAHVGEPQVTVHIVKTAPLEVKTELPGDAPRDKCTLSCAINGIHAAFHYLKKNYISGCVMTVPTGW